jgi:3-oxoacyl-[acyl-carrier protein] reductase
MDLGLKNRVAIVAASSQGIGRATAESFAAEGCVVAMCARSKDSLTKAADAIRDRSRTEVFAASLDVGDATAVHQFVEEVEKKYGRIDICVTNAGGPPAKGFLATSAADWDGAVRLNLLSVVYFAQAVIPHMQRQKWGRIVTITSITTKQPVADLVLSNAVRAGVMGLVRSLANEFGKDGFCKQRCPGFRLPTLELATARGSGKTQEIFDERLIPCQPNSWLASDRASYITGQTFLVDGGLYKGL